MAGRASITVLIPTRDEQVNLPYTLASVSEWTEQVFVIDSGSTDRTEQVAAEYQATFVSHPWEGYARQKNWALDNLPIRGKWVFFLDADEVITPELRDELVSIATLDSCLPNGFYVNRHLVFLGRHIRHCGYYPSYNVRFFRRGKARYEDREVHEHMIVDGAVGYLKEEMEHYDRRGFEHFIAKHNHYSTLEAREIFRMQRRMNQGRMTFSFWGGPVQRRRWLKHHIWQKLPARWMARWFYMYFFQLGILDGRAGLHLSLLLAEYEHQISLKLAELKKLQKLPVEASPNGVKGLRGPIILPAPVDDEEADSSVVPAPVRKALEGGQNHGTAVESSTTAAGDDAELPWREVNLENAEKWPYPMHEYALRIIWSTVWATVWKVCWHRWPTLRSVILRLFGAKCAMSVGISGSVQIIRPWDLTIGQRCMIGPRVHLYNLGGLTIGRHTVISQDSYICGGTHDYTDPTYPLLRKKITIGNFVWIAAGAFIGPGVTIGDGAVVGARAVVLKDVAPWTVVAGHPARFIKNREVYAPADGHQTTVTQTATVATVAGK